MANPTAGYLPRPVTPLDWIIVAFTLLMAFWGYLQGLIVGALSLAGFAAGALAGSRLGPLLLEEGSRSPYAPLFALTGALLLGRPARLRPRGARLPPPSPRGRPARAARRARRLAAGGVPRPGPRVGAGRGGAADPGRARAARADPALGDPEGAERGAAALGAAAEGAGALRPVPAHRGPRSRGSRAPDSAIARDPQVRAAGAQRGEGARHGMRARRAGIGLGGGRRRGGHQRPRRGRPGRHHRAGDGARARATTPTRSGSTRRTTWRSCAPPGCEGVPALAAERGGQPGHLAPRCSASRRTARTTCSPAGWGRPRR